MSDLNLYSVHWQDGMLLTQKHLKEQEKYFEDLAQWYASGIGDNYGLIRKSSEGKAALSLNTTVNGNRIVIEILQCQALTPNGSYIEINDSLGEVFRAEKEITDNNMPVFIGINPDLKKPVGEPDPSEDVPRIPYQIKNYVVHLGEKPNLPQDLFIQVANIVINGSEASLAPDYFPPCVTLNADDRLLSIATDYRNRLENLLTLASRAHTAVTARDAFKDATTGLQLAFKDTVYFLVYHLAATLDDFVVGRNAPHPLKMVIQFKKLFRVLSSMINLQPGLKDYLNERYFVKEHKSSIDRFIASVDAFLLSEYDHHNIATQVQMIDDVLGALRGVLGFLAQTKLEELGEQAVATETLTYQGKTYSNVGYGSCRLEQVGELSYLITNISEPCPISDTVTLLSKDLFTDAEWRSMQVRLGVNEARGLGETDPIDIDVTTFSNKVALHPRDMLKSSSVRQITLIFRGASDPQKLTKLGQMDLIIYAM